MFCTKSCESLRKPKSSYKQCEHLKKATPFANNNCESAKTKALCLRTKNMKTNIEHMLLHKKMRQPKGNQWFCANVYKHQMTTNIVAQEAAKTYGKHMCLHKKLRNPKDNKCLCAKSFQMRSFRMQSLPMQNYERKVFERRLTCLKLPTTKLPRTKPA